MGTQIRQHQGLLRFGRGKTGETEVATHARRHGRVTHVVLAFFLLSSIRPEYANAIPNCLVSMGQAARKVAAVAIPKIARPSLAGVMIAVGLTAVGITAFRPQLASFYDTSTKRLAVPALRAKSIVGDNYKRLTPYDYAVAAQVFRDAKDPAGDGCADTCAQFAFDAIMHHDDLTHGAVAEWARKLGLAKNPKMLLFPGSGGDGSFEKSWDNPNEKALWDVLMGQILRDRIKRAKESAAHLNDGSDMADENGRSEFENLADAAGSWKRHFRDGGLLAAPQIGKVTDPNELIKEFQRLGNIHSSEYSTKDNRIEELVIPLFKFDPQRQILPKWAIESGIPPELVTGPIAEKRLREFAARSDDNEKKLVALMSRFYTWHVLRGIPTSHPDYTLPVRDLRDAARIAEIMVQRRQSTYVPSIQ